MDVDSFIRSPGMLFIFGFWCNSSSVVLLWVFYLLCVMIWSLTVGGCARTWTMDADAVPPRRVCAEQAAQALGGTSVPPCNTNQTTPIVAVWMDGGVEPSLLPRIWWASAIKWCVTATPKGEAKYVVLVALFCRVLECHLRVQNAFDVICVDILGDDIDGRTCTTSIENASETSA